MRWCGKIAAHSKCRKGLLRRCVYKYIYIYSPLTAHVAGGSRREMGSGGEHCPIACSILGSWFQTNVGSMGQVWSMFMRSAAADAAPGHPAGLVLPSGCADLLLNAVTGARWWQGHHSKINLPLLLFLKTWIQFSSLQKAKPFQYLVFIPPAIQHDLSLLETLLHLSMPKNCRWTKTLRVYLHCVSVSHSHILSKEMNRMADIYNETHTVITPQGLAGESAQSDACWQLLKRFVHSARILTSVVCWKFHCYSSFQAVWH